MYDFFERNDYSYNKSPMDMGGKPFVTNVQQIVLQNNSFRRAIWTGKYLQMTIMSISQKEDIGMEMHPNLDQFLYVEQGLGVVITGINREDMNYTQPIYPGSGIFIPGGTWHNIINMGNKALKLFSIYAPSNHPFGTVEETKQG